MVDTSTMTLGELVNFSVRAVLADLMGEAPFPANTNRALAITNEYDNGFNRYEIADAIEAKFHELLSDGVEL